MKGVQSRLNLSNISQSLSRKQRDYLKILMDLSGYGNEGELLQFAHMFSVRAHFFMLLKWPPEKFHQGGG